MTSQQIYTKVLTEAFHNGFRLEQAQELARVASLLHHLEALGFPQSAVVNFLSLNQEQ